MAQDIEKLRDEAQRIFLDCETVLGVGIAGNKPYELVFLLKQNSAGARNAITSWARRRRIGFQFKVVGEITALEKN
jgi:hypothetical protein